MNNIRRRMCAWGKRCTVPTVPTVPINLTFTLFKFTSARATLTFAYVISLLPSRAHDLNSRSVCKSGRTCLENNTGPLSYRTSGRLSGIYTPEERCELKRRQSTTLLNPFEKCGWKVPTSRFRPEAGWAKPSPMRIHYGPEWKPILTTDVLK